jgi:hypothetical protein
MINMTPDELDAEMRYRTEERLAILCGSSEPTPEQKKIARIEAAQWYKEWVKGNDAAKPVDIPSR